MDVSQRRADRGCALQVPPPPPTNQDVSAMFRHLVGKMPEGRLEAIVQPPFIRTKKAINGWN